MSVLTSRTPQNIRIATGEKGGLYFQVGTLLKQHIAETSSRTVTLQETRGTVQNSDLLLSGKADLAIMQAGATELPGTIQVLAPLYLEPIHIIIRRNLAIKTFKDLKGRQISIGKKGSGMRKSARQILNHNGINPTMLRATDDYFLELLTNHELDGAIVTCGVLSPDLKRVMVSGAFDLLPIPNTEALAVLHPHLKQFKIPVGLFGSEVPTPGKSISTLAACSYLAVKEGAPDALVAITLESLHESSLRFELPTLVSKKAAKEWNLVPKHPAAESYYEPYKGLLLLGSMVEKFAAFKELLVGLFAGLYLLWNLRRWILTRRNDKQVAVQRNRLEELLAQTTTIERAQMEEKNISKLNQFLDDITRIKLKALDELQHEGLRGDRHFLIFLTQCTNVIRKIQAKIMTYSQS